MPARWGSLIPFDAPDPPSQISRNILASPASRPDAGTVREPHAVDLPQVSLPHSKGRAEGSRTVRVALGRLVIRLATNDDYNLPEPGGGW